MYLDVHRLTDVDLGGDDRADGGVPGAHDDGHVVRGRGVIRGRGSQALASGAPSSGKAAHGGRRPVSLICLVRERHAVREEHQLVSSVKLNITSQYQSSIVNTNLMMMYRPMSTPTVHPTDNRTVKSYLNKTIMYTVI